MATAHRRILLTRWIDMKRRCMNPTRLDYPRYGGRGIRVCERWMNFENFLEDMLPTFKEGLTLDRIDSDGDYSPDNCRWQTIKEQNNNKRNSKTVVIDGVSKTLTQWAEHFGIKPSTVRQRYYVYGWSELRSLGLTEKE